MPSVKNVVVVVFTLLFQNWLFTASRAAASEGAVNIVPTKHKSLQFGPVRIFPPSPKRKSYSWRAAVDRTLGRAFSRETSNLVPIGTEKDSRKINAPNFDAVVFRTLASYPSWLCRGSQSLGLLKAVKTSDGGCDVQTRWGSCSVLSFDRPRRHGQLHPLSSILPLFFSSDCTVELPISGGALAITGTPGGNGSLWFTIQKRNTSFKGSLNCGTFKTEIQSYRPSLCGKKIPTSALRSRLYLGTQSLVHGFVMWRFHTHVARQISC
jgi:hypothetical protein